MLSLILNIVNIISQTIINYLRGEPEKQVEVAFNKFREIQIGLQWPGSSEECEIEQVTFDEFKKVMESLKQEIKDGAKRKLKLVKDKKMEVDRLQ